MAIASTVTIAITMIKRLFITPSEELPTAVVYDQENRGLADQTWKARKQCPIVDLSARNQRMESSNDGELHSITKAEKQPTPASLLY